MHPLEPLSAEEIKAAAALVKDGGHLGDRGRFSSITLVEPPKGDGRTSERQAVMRPQFRSLTSMNCGFVRMISARRSKSSCG